MPTVDLIAGLLIVGMVVWGFWAGLAGTLALTGFAAGAVAGAKLAPLALNDGHDSSFALVFALPGALLLGALVAAAVERLILRLRKRRVRLDGRGRMSAIGGALLAGCTAVVAVWLLGAGVVQVDSLRTPVEDSTIVGRLNALLPPPGPPAAQQQRPFDPFPVVAGPGPQIPPADERMVNDPQVRVADRSVVKIAVLSSCGAAMGSGWIAADGIVVTNAHVVAAADAVTVRIGGSGPAHPATAIWYEPGNDVALLRAPGLKGARVLPTVRRPRAGTPGAVIGFPSGRHRVSPARLGRTTRQARGRLGNVPRSAGFPRGLAGRLVTPFRGRAEPGSSGGPVVDARGRVLTTVSVGGGMRESGYGVPNRFVRSALRRARRAGPPVDTGTCSRSSARSRGR